MGEEFFEAGNALAGGADVAALATVCATFAGEAVIGSEGDCTGAEKLWGGAAGGDLQNSPADGAVADVESKMQIRRI